MDKRPMHLGIEFRGANQITQVDTYSFVFALTNSTFGHKKKGKVIVLIFMEQYYKYSFPKCITSPKRMCTNFYFAIRINWTIFFVFKFMQINYFNLSFRLFCFKFFFKFYIFLQLELFYSTNQMNFFFLGCSWCTLSPLLHEFLCCITRFRNKTKIRKV